MRIMSSLLRTAGIGLILAPSGVFAHHSFAAEFDPELPVEVSGTVTRVEWTNPHARFYVEVEDENGEVVDWDFELGSPNTLFRRGWKRDTLKPGDVITVSAFRARNAVHVANTRRVTLSDGRQVFSSGVGAAAAPE